MKRYERYIHNQAHACLQSYPQMNIDTYTVVYLQIFSPVSDFLKETQDFFMKNTQHNMKTWAALQERLGRSRQHFKQYELFNSAQGYYSPPIAGMYCYT